MITCCNYMEKYMPLYLQRSMSDFLEYIHTDRAVRWRIGWYNEIKVPMLTAAILFDNGSESINERIAGLEKLVRENILPSLPQESSAMTEEEMFVLASLRNRQIHARAKLLIMQMLNQIQNPTTKGSNSRKLTQRDYNNATVTQIFNDLFKMLEKEFPTQIEALLKEAVQQDQHQE